MSSILDSLNNRAFLFQRENLITETQIEIIKLILIKSGYKDNILLLKQIDENDNYDSFLVEIEGPLGICVKISFDPEWINYDFLLLSGVQFDNICPKPIDRGKLTEFEKTIYYTLQTYEYSNSLKSLGFPILLTDEYNDFFKKLKQLHSVNIPNNIIEHFDDIKSYLIYHKFNFNSILEYVETSESEDYKNAKFIYEQVFDQMINCINENFNTINDTHLVHGNLDGSTIICNNFLFKFINFENSFRGNMLFDIVNIVFELQAAGINEFDFVKKYINIFYNSNESKNDIRHLDDEILKYTICKKIWTYKIFLDLVKNYLLEVIVLNLQRKEKIIALTNEFSKHFYKFDNNIAIFPEYKAFFIEKLEIILANI
jgi:hypothetical protein